MRWSEIPCRLYVCDEHTDMLAEMGIQVDDDEEIKTTIMMDLDEVESCHAHSKEDTKVYFKSGFHYVVDLKYGEFKKLLLLKS